MKIDDLKQTLDIKPSVVELVKEVEAKTGKPVEVRLDKEMQAPATVKIARERMPYHLLKLHPSQASVAGYLVVNKCSNILRMANADPSERVIPSTTADSSRAAMAVLERELGARMAQVPRNILDFWVGGLINQLVNLPVQVRIERWVHANFPELRDEQTAYLKKDVEETVAGVSEKIERVTPPFIFATSNTMTYAFVRGVGEIMGANLTSRYRNYPKILGRGQELYDLIGDSDDESHASDVTLINQWAQRLGIERWFVWHNFEDMPESYYADIV